MSFGEASCIKIPSEGVEIMKMALMGNTLLIKDATNEQRAEIESWGLTEWNAEMQIFSGAADLELLDKLAGMVRLPPAAADYSDHLRKAAEHTVEQPQEPPPKWPGELTLQGNELQISCVDSISFSIIKSWRRLKWDRKTQSFRGTVNLELLDKLAGMGRLPSEIAAYRDRLRTVQDAVDRERVRKTPAPLYDYPVKMPLYAHQVRAANMALLTFGWVEIK